MNKFTKSAMLSFMFATAAVGQEEQKPLLRPTIHNYRIILPSDILNIANQESDTTLEQLLANVQENHLVCVTNETTNEQVCGTDLLAQLFALHVQKHHTGPKLSTETSAPTVEEIKEEKIAELTEEAK